MRARSTILVPIASWLAGCDAGYTYTGHRVSEYVALDGDRTWTYANEAQDYKLDVEKDPITERDDEIEIVTLEYSKHDPAELLYLVKWSSDGTSGVQIHGYKDEAGGGDWINLDPPFLVSDYQALKDDVFITETNGSTWTSTFEAKEACPNLWVSEDWECLRFNIDDGGAGAPFAGVWWFAADWGPSRFLLNSDTDEWVLAEATWEPVED